MNMGGRHGLPAWSGLGLTSYALAYIERVAFKH